MEYYQVVIDDRIFLCFKAAIFGAVLVTLTFVVLQLDYVNYLDHKLVKWDDMMCLHVDIYMFAINLSVVSTTQHLMSQRQHVSSHIITC